MIASKEPNLFSKRTRPSGLFLMLLVKSFEELVSSEPKLSVYFSDNLGSELL